MQLTYIMMFLCVISVFIPFVSTVVGMGGLLILSALLVTMVVGQILSSWFAFIVFLIYITGLLVIFSYMLAMSPNVYGSEFNFSWSLFLCCFFLLMFCFMLKYVGMVSVGVDYEWDVLYLFSGLGLSIYWFISLVLLISLVLVVNLCYKVPSPLRPFYNS